MKIVNVYDEAVESGLNRREASYIAAAHDLATLVRSVRNEQTDFLRKIGLSWEDARALDDQGRAALNEKWLSRSSKPAG